MNFQTIKKWSIGTKPSYIAPELARSCLQGEIYNDCRGKFADGHPVITSGIENVIDEGSHKIVVTKNSRYWIFPEDVDPEYEKKFPSAFERLSVKKVG